MPRFDPEDRDAFVESVDGVLAREFSSEVRRELWSDETGRSPRLWKALSEIGVNGLLIDEEYGGGGASEVELGRTLESLARFGVHDTVLEGQVAASFLQFAGDAGLRERWLPGIAAGTTRVALKLTSSRFVRDAHVADIVVYQTNESVYLLAPRDVV
jgi:alkylation response protein AidB-like acyl-CoA dehydrogenase